MLRNVGSNWALNIFNMALALVMGAFVVGVIGEEGDGQWSVIDGYTGLLSLILLGVPMASVKLLSENVGKDHTAAFNRAVGSCLGLYLVFGGLAVAAGALLYIPFEFGAIQGGFVIPEWVGDLRLAWWLTVAYVAYGFVAQLPYGLMVAHQDFVLRNKIMMAGGLVKLVSVIVLLSLRSSISFIVLSQMLALTVEFLVARACALRRYPGVRISLSDFDRATVRKIFSFSIFVLFLQLGIKLSFHVDAVVISWFLRPEDASYYKRCNLFIGYLVEFLIAIGSVVMPMAARLKKEGREGELSVVFLRWSKVALVVSAVATVFLGILGPEFVGAWLDKPSYVAPAERVLPWLMGSCLVFLPVRGVALPLLMGLGRPLFPTLAFLVAGVLNLGLSVLLAPHLALTGIALGTAIPNVLFALVIAVYACRTLGVRPLDYLAYVAPKAILGALPAAACALWLKMEYGVVTRLEVFVSGVLVCLVFGVTCLLFVFRGDPHVDLGPVMRRLRR